MKTWAVVSTLTSWTPVKPRAMQERLVTLYVHRILNCSIC